MTGRVPVTICRRRPWLLWAGIALGALWGLAQLGRESLWPTGILFSLLPSPLIVLTTAGMALCAWHSRRRCLAATAFVLMLPPLASVAWLENDWWSKTARLPHVADAKTERTVVHWNVARGALGWPAVQQILGAQAADFYLISEPPRGVDLEPTAQWPGADMTVADLPHMAAIARGQLTVVDVRTFGGGVGCLLTWHWRDKDVRVLAIDLPPDQLRPRAPLLDWVIQQISADSPDLVLGDFNTPRGCRRLLALPTGYTHAYGAAGRGWSYTWPMLCPLWAIDQALVGPRARTLEYELVTTLRSDHRLQRLRVAIVKSRVLPTPVARPSP